MLLMVCDDTIYSNKTPTHYKSGKPFVCLPCCCALQLKMLRCSTTCALTTMCKTDFLIGTLVFPPAKRNKCA